ncbi:MAG: outer membrane lipoprotein-sorting protein [Kiritimatiellae bacterium]|nr:outer membrane lipoprotein-sorting protein [Kiritimatiellia bacterium]
MKIFAFVLFVFFTCFNVIADDVNQLSSIKTLTSTQSVLNASSSASDVLLACRSMLPRSRIRLDGDIILRNKKGIVQNEYSYSLYMDRTNPMESLRVRICKRDTDEEIMEVTISRSKNGVSKIWKRNANEDKMTEIPSILDNVMDTDVTWLDLTLDFLWWKNPVFEEERESESVHGQRCSVILVAPQTPIEGMAAVRLWADKKTGCLMQAEQLNPQMETMRRLWGTRVKKFGERWMANVLEVETIGSGHRTKITVEDIVE